MFNYKNKWLVSYETLLFDTPDGDLDIGQYALDGNGTGYYIRTKPKSEAQFEWVDSTYDVSKLTLVHIVPGHAYYDEFLTAFGATALWGVAKAGEIPAGGKIRIRSSAAKYNPLRYVKDAPQPSRTEQVTALPPDEPKSDPLEHHSIGFDATSNSGAYGAVSSYSWNHTCTGSNLLLVFGDSHRVSTTDRTVSAVTYNAVPLTYIRSDVNQSVFPTFYRASLFYLIAPESGSALSVSVTLSGTVTNGVGGVVSLTGTKQSAQPDAHNGAAVGSSDPITIAVTTIVDNCWVFSVIAADSPPVTSNNTERWEVDAGNGGGSDTNGPKTPPGAQIMSWNNPFGGSYNAISAASFAPDVPTSKVGSMASRLVVVRLI